MTDRDLLVAQISRLDNLVGGCPMLQEQQPALARAVTEMRRLVLDGITSLDQDGSGSTGNVCKPVGTDARSETQSSPLTAEFLFYLFMTPQNCDALVGDLEERYRKIQRKFGRRRANFWYWTQVVRSLGPIVFAWSKKIVLKPVIAIVTWAVAKGLIGHDGWLAAVVELWKRVRS